MSVTTMAVTKRPPSIGQQHPVFYASLEITGAGLGDAFYGGGNGYEFLC